MTIPRLFGSIVLQGSVRKKLSTAAYNEYTHVARQLKDSGLLKNMKAELKVKSKTKILSKKPQDYVQLSYKGAAGDVQKLKLDKRLPKQTIENYLKEAIQKARKIDAAAIKTGMPKSKGYDNYTNAWKANKTAFGNLPEKASVEVKRSGITGHKRAVVRLPVTNQDGKTTFLTQTVKKARKQDIGQFLNDVTEHANLVFENSINHKGLLSVRQIQEKAKTVQRENTQFSAQGLKNAYKKATQKAAEYAEIAPGTPESFAALKQANLAYEKLLKRRNRQAQFGYVNREFSNLKQQLAQSPSRVKTGMDLTAEREKTYDLYQKMELGLRGKYAKPFIQKIKQGEKQFDEAKAAAEAAEKANDAVEGGFFNRINPFA